MPILLAATANSPVLNAQRVVVQTVRIIAVKAVRIQVNARLNVNCK
jgi:hypothetical protein